MTPRCLSQADAAKYCGVSSQTLRRHGPPPLRIGTARVYDVRTLDSWLDGLAGTATVTAANDAEAAMLAALNQ